MNPVIKVVVDGVEVTYYLLAVTLHSGTDGEGHHLVRLCTKNPALLLECSDLRRSVGTHA